MRRLLRGGECLLSATECNSTDLAQVPREIHCEPSDQQSPKYALIMTGSKAEQRFLRHCSRNSDPGRLASD